MTKSNSSATHHTWMHYEHPWYAQLRKLDATITYEYPLPPKHRLATTGVKYTKCCTKCRVTKLVREFHSSKYSKDGYRSWCKTCNNADKDARWNRLSDAEYLYKLAKARAKRLNREFTITVSDVEAVNTDCCPLLRIPIKRYYLSGKNKQRYNDSKSLDRIDPTKGYIPGNIRVISWRANNLLGVGHTEQDLLNTTNGNQI